MGVKQVSLSQPCRLSFQTKSVSDKLWCRSRRLFAVNWLSMWTIKRSTSTFTQHVSATGFPNIKQFELDGLDVHVKAVMRHTWAAPELPHGIHRKDVHHNGPCVCETANREKGAENGSKGQRDIPLGLKLPLYLYYRWNFCFCICAIIIVMREFPQLLATKIH